MNIDARHVLLERPYRSLSSARLTSTCPLLEKRRGCLRRLILGVGAIALTFVFAAKSFATVFVDVDASPGGDGNSWASAYQTIQAGIDDADVANEEVWVAEGTYNESITMKDGVAVYGGFDGTETLLSQRDIEANVTTIDASTADGGGPAEHVVVINNVMNSRINGFTLTGGNASATGSGPSACGGGIYCSGSDDTNTIANCTIADNSASYDGGGVHCEASSPTISDCVITGNTADYHGGGIRCGNESAPTIGDSVIAENWADQGGGIYCTDGSAPMIVGCTIIGNSAGGDGGGVHFTSEYISCYPTITDCVIACNSAYWDGGGVYCRDLSCPTLTRCAVSGNSARHGAGLMCASDSPETIINCTISGNTGSGSGGGIFCSESSATISNSTIAANSSSGGGGVGCDWYSIPTITNTVFVDNTQHAVYESQSSDPVVTYCLFYANPDGDYYDEETGSHTGADNINLNVSEASNNIDGDPRFSMDLGAVWTASPTYNSSSNRTTLTAASSSFAPGVLVGHLLNPNTSQRRQVFITANTATTIQVVGDVTGYVSSGDTYQLIDYHLLHGSPCIDTGTDSGAPSNDMDGDPRPVDVLGRGADHTGTEYDIGADEFCDSDGDGVPDYKDAFPRNPRGQTDSDGDGIGDEWEDRWFGNNNGVIEPGDLNGAGEDTDYDSDECLDVTEFTHGSDPTDPLSGVPVAGAVGLVLLSLGILGGAAYRRRKR